MKKETDIYRKLWSFFRKGNAEVWFLITIYNMIQLWILRGQKLYVIMLIIMGMAFMCLIVGYIMIKKVETTQPYIRPFIQDSIKSDMLFYEAMLNMVEDEFSYYSLKKASHNLKEAIEIRKKWMDIS